MDLLAESADFNSFCVKYRAWRSMRQPHLAGEKLFVEYAGKNDANDATAM